MTGDVSDSWDDDFSFSGDLRISDAMSRQNDMLNAHLQQVRFFSRDTKKLDEILTENFSENEVDFSNTEDCVLKALDLVALANEDRTRCSVFKTRLGKSYLQKTETSSQFYPTLKFLGQSIIRVDGANLPRLCGYTGIVLRSIEAETSDLLPDSDWDLSGNQDQSISFMNGGDFHINDTHVGDISGNSFDEGNAGLDHANDRIRNHISGNISNHSRSDSAEISASVSELNQAFDQMLFLGAGDAKASDLSTENLEPTTPESFDFIEDFPDSEEDQAQEKLMGKSPSVVTEDCNATTDYLFASHQRNKQELDDSFTGMAASKSNIHNKTRTQDICQQDGAQDIFQHNEEHGFESEHERGHGPESNEPNGGAKLEHEFPAHCIPESKSLLKEASENETLIIKAPEVPKFESERNSPQD